MILSAHKTPDYVRALNRYSKHDPFACRILSLYHSYRPDLPFVDYWMLTDDDGVFTGAAARNGSCFILFLTDRSNLSEVSAFMRVAGASQVLLNGRYRLDVEGSETEGVVMKLCRKPEEATGAGNLVQPAIKAAYEVIVKSAGKGMTPPPFEDFYVDVNHRLRHGTMRLIGVTDGGKPAAVAMTVAEGGGGAVLGAVACDPRYRRKGYGTLMVTELCARLSAENKTVYLHRVKDRNAAFYERLGFEDCGTWREIRFSR